ncbi:MAG: sulfur carrier protein ThiS [Phycisphaerales bacterium]|nr:sulfur carrier protein ThiS [Phycisphaerales bacterium]
MTLQINGEPRSVAPGLTVEALLRELGLAAQPCAVEVNRELVPKSRQSDHGLHAGDAVEIVTLVGGG